MDRCGTRVTTSWMWMMWIRGCHIAGYCLEILYIRDLPLYDHQASEYIVECCLHRCLHYGFPCVLQSSIVCTLIPCYPRLSGGLIQFLIRLRRRQVCKSNDKECCHIFIYTKGMKENTLIYLSLWTTSSDTMIRN